MQNSGFIILIALKIGFLRLWQDQEAEMHTYTLFSVIEPEILDFYFRNL